MAIKVDVKNINILVNKLQGYPDKIQAALEAKMSYYLTNLQQKIRSTKFPEILAENVGDPIIDKRPGAIEGRIPWLGNTNPYVINPLEEFFPKNFKGGKMPRGSHLPALKFLAGGKEVWAPSVFHPPFPYEQKYQNALESMKAEIKEGLKETLTGVVKGEIG